MFPALLGMLWITSRFVDAPDRDTCERYASVPLERTVAGLGHRFGDIVFTLLMAKRFDAHPVFDWDGFFFDEAGRATPWFPKLLGIDREPSLHQFEGVHQHQVVHVDDWTGAPAFAFREKPCGTLLRSCDTCCDGSSCFLHVEGAYEEGRRLLQPFIANSPAKAIPSWTIPGTDPACLVIAAHVRTGDVEFGCEGPDSAQRVAHLLLRATQPECAHVILVSQAKLDSSCTRINPGPVDVRVRNRFGESTETAFRLFAAADVLISTGSSMPVVAAMLSPVVHIAGMPKENTRSVYHLSTDVILDNGRFTEDQAADICDRVEHRRGVLKC